MVFRPRNGISLCSGGGGLELGLQLAEPSFACRCFVEADADAQAVLVGGMAPDQLDRLYAKLAAADLPDSVDQMARNSPYPGRYARPFHTAAVWSDVRTFVGDAWRGYIDLVCAGYPCQPFSAAGKRGGSDDPRHLWPDVARIYWETGAEWGVFENVAGHISLGLETVLRDLWDMGATPAVGLFSSGETGGSHERQRVFIVAHRKSSDRRREQPAASARRGRAGFTGSCGENVGDTGHHHDARGLDRGTDSGEASRGESQHESRGKAPHGERVRRESSSSGDDVDHAASPRCDNAGKRSGSNQQGGECVSGAGCDQLADAGQQGPQGKFPDRIDPKRREVEAGLAGLRSRTGLLSPPGPGQTAVWGHILSLAPDLAPSLAIRDIISRANDLAAMVAEGSVAEPQAQSDLRRMADAMAARPRALRMYGNGVDPLVAGYAWRTLSAAHGLRPLDLGTALYHPTTGTNAGEFI